MFCFCFSPFFFCEEENVKSHFISKQIEVKRELSSEKMSIKNMNGRKWLNGK